MNARRTILLGFGLGISIALSLAAATAFPQTSTSARSFEFTYLVHVPKLPEGAKTLRLWVPLPQSNHYQTIRDLKIDSSVPYSRHREPEFGNQYLYLYLVATAAQVQQPFQVKLTFHATRREHRVLLDARSAKASASDPEPRAVLARFLRPDRLVPINGVIHDLAEHQTRGLTDPLQKARAIYNYVIATLRYDKSGTGWGHGDAIWACTAKRGNCTDFHSLFIGMARAVGIPARFEIGFPLPPDQHEGTIPGYHCWAEFYVQPYGWIPIDASEAWQNPSKRDYFFGAHDANRIQFTIGRDIRLQPAPQGGPLNYFVYPYAELDGKPFDGFQDKFSFRDLGNGIRSAGD